MYFNIFIHASVALLYPKIILRGMGKHVWLLPVHFFQHLFKALNISAV